MSASVHVHLRARDAAAARGLASVVGHTPIGVPMSVGGPAAGGARAWLDAVAGGARLKLAPLDAGVGRHVAVLDARTLVPSGWLERLEAAARNATGPVATVSPLAVGAGQTAVIDPPADPAVLEKMATAVRERAAGLHPRIAAPTVYCMLVARAALELAGPLDDAFPARCAAAGLLHVVADDLLVVLPETVSEPPEPLAEEHEWQREQEDLAPLGRSRALARRAVAGLSVTIDARALSGSLTGTQVHTLELVAALHRTGALKLRVVVPPDLLAEAEAVLAALEDAAVLPAIGIDQHTARSDIVHRPYQISGPADTKLLRRVARRRVITHQDLLGFHNPSYHPSDEHWEAHRRLTRATLAIADLVVAFSDHVAADLLAEDLVDSARLEVVPIGIDHRLSRLVAAPEAPRGARGLADAPFLVCVGTDLLHKNRPFALALFAALRDRGWAGRLALAGTHVPVGASAAEEAVWRQAHPELARAVVDLGPVAESGKAWLYRHASAALYPTVSEGFGLIPFEAADAGIPTLHAGGSALDELLPGTATLVPWEVGASADRVLALLRDAAAAASLVEQIAAAGRRLTWDRTAERLVTSYDAVLARPPSPAAEVGWTALAAEDRLGHSEGIHAQLLQTIGPTGLALVGEDGLLPEDAQRALAALAQRRATRRPLLTALAGLRRLANRSNSR